MIDGEIIKDKVNGYFDKKGLSDEEKEDLVLEMFFEYRENNKGQYEDEEDEDLDEIEDEIDDMDDKEASKKNAKEDAKTTEKSKSDERKIDQLLNEK